ncbi:hypothetical protein SDC9_197956 [bioreactor metagenome]|uniref:Uncharacterized protein n=1 Tax=bioreactor metagenome TaxID=1076179 RepID=A0A645IGU5_9ZZZZ
MPAGQGDPPVRIVDCGHKQNDHQQNKRSHHQRQGQPVKNVVVHTGGNVHRRKANNGKQHLVFNKMKAVLKTIQRRGIRRRKQHNEAKDHKNQHNDKERRIQPAAALFLKRRSGRPLFAAFLFFALLKQGASPLAYDVVSSDTGK